MYVNNPNVGLQKLHLSPRPAISATPRSPGDQRATLANQELFLRSKNRTLNFQKPTNQKQTKNKPNQKQTNENKRKQTRTNKQTNKQEQKNKPLALCVLTLNLLFFLMLYTTFSALLLLL